jgi:hypothetical protein
MVFGINFIAIIKAELLKYKDKAGTPIAVDVLNDLEKTLVVINGFVSKLTPGDIQAILSLLPPSVIAKFPPGALATLANELASLPTELTSLESAITELITDLGEK